MSELLPRKPPVDNEPTESRLVTLDDEEDVLSALQSETARAVLDALHDEPMPPSAIAEFLGLSVQTVCYHLERLEAVNLVEVADEWYSPKGRKMDVYAPTTESLIVVIGDTG